MRGLREHTRPKQSLTLKGHYKWVLGIVIKCIHHFHKRQSSIPIQNKSQNLHEQNAFAQKENLQGLPGPLTIFPLQQKTVPKFVCSLPKIILEIIISDDTSVFSLIQEAVIVSSCLRTTTHMDMQQRMHNI